MEAGTPLSERAPLRGKPLLHTPDVGWAGQSYLLGEESGLSFRVAALATSSEAACLRLESKCEYIINERSWEI
jgi:hypothetical protein